MMPTREHPTCPTHPHVRLRCPACTGAKGGKALTPKKLRALKRISRLPRPRDGEEPRA